MLQPKFYYGEDVITKQQPYKVMAHLVSKRTSRETKSVQRLNTKNSQSPKSYLKNNITELPTEQIRGQTLLDRKKQYLLLDQVKKNLNETDNSCKVEVHQPFRKIEAKLQNIVDEQTFLQSLKLKEEAKAIKFKINRSKERSKERNCSMEKSKILRINQSELSLEKSQIPQLKSQQSIRSELFKDYKISLELKQYHYKLILAYHYTSKISQNQMTLEENIGTNEKFLSYMNIKQNLINLPLNIKGLEEFYGSYKHLYKSIRPNIPTTLEHFILDDKEQIKQHSLQSQLFHLFIHYSEMNETVSSQNVKFTLTPPQSFFAIVDRIERNLSLNQSNTPKCTKSFYHLTLSLETLKVVYCFCNKISDLLSAKVAVESQQREPYRRDFDFSEALKKLKNVNYNTKTKNLFLQFKLFKTELPSQLEKLESKFALVSEIGRSEVLRNNPDFSYIYFPNVPQYKNYQIFNILIRFFQLMNHLINEQSHYFSTPLNSLAKVIREPPVHGDDSIQASPRDMEIWLKTTSSQSIQIHPKKETKRMAFQQKKMIWV